MDGLDDEERALAWAAAWNPNFVGVAVVNKDFTFRSVNEQWWEFFGVTPAEFIGKTFSDITPEPLKSIDMQNAKLVQQKRITSYILPKCYEFSDGRRVDFVLLVVGVYSRETGDFLFYISRIIRDGLKNDSSNTPSQKPISSIWKTIAQNWHVVTALSASLALIVAEIIRQMRAL